MSRRTLWEQLSARFDPFEYVPKAWRADRSHSPAGQIERELDTPFAHNARFLMVGTIGSGKTTELLRVREARELREFVVYLDLARYFEQRGSAESLQHVRQWEVCFYAGLVIAGEYTRRYGALPSQLLEDLHQAYVAVARTADADAVELDIAIAGKALITLGAAIAAVAGAPAAAVTLAGAAAAAPDAVKHLGVPFGRAKKRIDDDDPHVQSLLDRVNAIISEIQRQGKPVLLIIDGLDRIRDGERAKELFVASDLIARLACRLVVCGPYALRHNQAVANTPRFRVTVLVNEPVVDQYVPTKPGPGLGFFRDLFERRTRDLAGPPIIEPALLDRLAYACGGRARDFVKAARMAVQRAWSEDVDMLHEALITAVLDEERRLLETGLHTGHIALLQRVRDDPEHRLPDDPLVNDLLLYSRLLPYPDGSEWFYPHPLLASFLT